MMKRLLILIAMLAYAPHGWGAIAFVDDGAVDAVNGNSITPGLPTASTGDVSLLVAVHGQDDINTVSGWQAETQHDGPPRNVRFFLRSRPAGASAPTVTSTGSQVFLGIIYAFSGVSTTSPLDAAYSCSNDTSGTNDTMTAPAIVTNTADTMVIRVYASANAESTTHNAHSEGTLIGVESTTLGFDVQLSTTYVAQPSAGSTGTATAVTTAPSGSRQWVACTLALAEAGAGTPTVVFDSSTYDLGDDLTVTASGFGNPLTTATEQAGGDTITAEAGATSSEAVFSLPSLDDLAPGGTAAHTKIETALNVEITDDTDTATDSLTINCPSDATCGELACNGIVNFWDQFTAGDCPKNSIAPAAADIGDDYVCRNVTQGITPAVENDYLIPRVTTQVVNVTVACRIFDESGGVWLPETELAYQLPSTEFLTEEDETTRQLILCDDGKYREDCS